MLAFRIGSHDHRVGHPARAVFERLESGVIARLAEAPEPITIPLAKTALTK
jgi:hypothetical protein